MVFVYDIHPLSKTLYDEHLSPMAQSHARSNMLSQLPERVLWSYAIQLANVLTTIHANKLAARTVEVSKILITGQHRVRLNGCGMLDVIHCDINDDDTLFRLQVRNLRCARLVKWLKPSSIFNSKQIYST